MRSWGGYCKHKKTPEHFTRLKVYISNLGSFESLNPSSETKHVVTQITQCQSWAPTLSLSRPCTASHTHGIQCNTQMEFRALQHQREGELTEFNGLLVRNVKESQSLHLLVAFWLCLLLGTRAGSCRVLCCVWLSGVSILIGTSCHRSQQKQQKHRQKKLRGCDYRI